MHYFYVSFQWDADYQNGYGSTVIECKTREFPYHEAQEFLKMKQNVKSVIITSASKTTKSEYMEWRVVNKHEEAKEATS